MPNSCKNNVISIVFLFLSQAGLAATEPPLLSPHMGGVARPEDIFKTGRGTLLPPSGDLPEESPPAEPVVKITQSATKPSPTESSATNIPPPLISAPIKENDALPLARGDLQEIHDTPLAENLGRNIALSLGGLVLSTSLDNAGDHFARNQGNQGAVKALANVGNLLPFIAMGAAGLAALDSTDPRLSRTGFAALQAGGASIVSSLGIKYAVARARPEADLGSSSFHNSAVKAGDSSFPSIHTATVWGAITPFAKEYDAPWLYGVAALTNFARVTKRKHWVSDTVAGSLIGYWAGDIAWHRNKPKPESSMQVFIDESSISFVWPLQ